MGCVGLCVWSVWVGMLYVCACMWMGACMWMNIHMYVCPGLGLFSQACVCVCVCAPTSRIEDVSLAQFIGRGGSLDKGGVGARSDKGKGHKGREDKSLAKHGFLVLLVCCRKMGVCICVLCMWIYGCVCLSVIVEKDGNEPGRDSLTKRTKAEVTEMRVGVAIK